MSETQSDEELAAAWGSRIVLGAAPDAPVQVRCGTVPLFEARSGRRRNRMAVRIERELPRGGTEPPAD